MLLMTRPDRRKIFQGTSSGATGTAAKFNVTRIVHVININKLHFYPEKRCNRQVINVWHSSSINERPKLTTKQANNNGGIQNSSYGDRHIKTIHAMDASALAYCNGLFLQTPCSQPTWLHNLDYPSQLHPKLRQIVDLNEKTDSHTRKLTSGFEKTMK